MGPVRHTRRGEVRVVGSGDGGPDGPSGGTAQRTDRRPSAAACGSGLRASGKAGLKAAAGVVLAVAAVVSACGGPRRTLGAAPVSGGRSSPAAVAGTSDAAVVQAWITAVQTVYRYDREPWPAIRRSLIAGTPPLQLFPDLGRYFTGAALSGVVQSVVGIKLQELNGAKIDRLGSPTVVSMRGSTATVADCGYDSGTTTATGKPGPATLDGGAGYGKGKWTLRRLGAQWKIASGQITVVSSCP